MKTQTLLFLLSFAISGSAQYGFGYSPAADMPMATSNHAVVGASVNGNNFMYSFCGIDTSLHYTGIHLRSFKYDVANDQWALLPDVPDTLGKIAASASEVDGIIYVIGGYHVLAGPPYELSSNKVHRFDTQSDSWLSDGADIPVAIDDQFQGVWRDSLIYVVTGWSNNTNVPNVQIYNPANDQWMAGTSVPNNNDYKCFGSNGVIIGDTIFYYGGASTAFNFPAQAELRKGVIDPTNPTQISWSEDDNTPGPIYRPAAFALDDNRPVWVGGAAISYNYDAQAYSGGAIVQPLAETRQISTTGVWVPVSFDLEVMDLRGIASFSGTPDYWRHFICGGIGVNAQVLNQCGWIQQNALDIDENLAENEDISIFPNPALNNVNIRVLGSVKYTEYQILDSYGGVVKTSSFTGPEQVLDIENLPAGAYFLKLIGTSHVTVCRFWSVK